MTVMIMMMPEKMERRRKEVDARVDPMFVQHRSNGKCKRFYVFVCS